MALERSLVARCARGANPFFFVHHQENLNLPGHHVGLSADGVAAPHFMPRKPALHLAWGNRKVVALGRIANHSRGQRRGRRAFCGRDPAVEKEATGDSGGTRDDQEMSRPDRHRHLLAAAKPVSWR